MHIISCIARQETIVTLSTENDTHTPITPIAIDKINGSVIMVHLNLNKQYHYYLMEHIGHLIQHMNKNVADAPQSLQCVI